MNDFPITLKGCLWELLRAIRGLNLSAAAGGFSMRLVHFLDGTKDVWVNPQMVSSIEETAPLRTKIHMSDAVTYTVDGAHGAIAALIANDTE